MAGLKLLAVALLAAVLACSAARPSQLALPVPGASPLPSEVQLVPPDESQAPAPLPPPPPAAAPAAAAPLPVPVAQQLAPPAVEQPQPAMPPAVKPPAAPPVPEAAAAGMPTAAPPSPEATAPQPAPPAAPSPSPAAAAPTAPPPPAQPASRQCVLLPNTNASGRNLQSLSTPTVADCCEACKQAPPCNVFVHCSRGSGCDDGSGKVYPQGSCALKQQGPIPAGGQPAVYAAGSIVQWSSGYLTA